MSSFYGTNIITHIPRSNFIIAHTFPNASKMFSTISEDKVPIYGYVMVDYNHPNNDFKEDDQTGLYQFNNQIDQLKWGSDTLIINYDQTVWQKLYDYNHSLTYRAVTRLNSILPTFDKPADFFKKEDSITTFQRLNAIPFAQRDIPKSYNAFGIEQLNEIEISFDAEAVKLFNDRYPSPRNELIMEMHEKHDLSKDNSLIFGKKIEQKILAIESGIQNTKQVLKTAQQNIDKQTNLITAKLKTDPDNAITTYNLINEYNNEIKEQNNIYAGELLALDDLQDDLTYYSEMKVWYNETFLPQLSKLIVYEMPEKLRKFNSNTLEYPTK